jgi:glycosyltransferase involved in cell wall biosynthesis
MKIAQIAPLYEAVPPKLYGGTERIVYYLTEELVELGNEVSLFASGDSKTKARLIANVDIALRLDLTCEDPLAPHIVQMQEVIDRLDEFDLLHFHTDYLHFPVTSSLKIPCLTTLHGRLDIKDLANVYNKFSSQKVVSISDSQRAPISQANFIGTVYHGLPIDLYEPGEGKGDYLVFLGRISPEKGVDTAIQIAIGSKMRLKIAAKVDHVDKQFFERRIQPLFDHPLIEFIGEINETQKARLLGGAKAMLFPINWPEPFGLVMIEAMACGTPVIAFRNGSVPEVIDEGQSGFIVNTVKEAVKAVSKIDRLSRASVRELFEKRFSSKRMAKDYLRLYSSLLSGRINRNSNLSSMTGIL